MKTHLQAVALLHIVLGCLSLLAAIAIFAFFGVAAGVAGYHEAPPGVVGLFGIFIAALCTLLALVSLPGIIGGWGLYTGRAWARPLIIVLSILHICNFPFGTVVSVYTLWVLFCDSPPAPAAV